MVLGIGSLHFKLASMPLTGGYIDDIFAISKKPLSELLEGLNEVNSAICFTVEESATDCLPFLDTLTSSQDGMFSTGFYVKPSHSGHILPWDSSVPFQRKIALIKNEKLRACRNCSSAVLRDRAFREIRCRFVANGYPNNIIDNVLFSNNRFNYETRRSDSGKPIVYFRVPFFSDHQANQVRRELRLCLPVTIKPIFITPSSLAKQLKPSHRLECPSRCFCLNQQFCFRKNVVYRITCKLCKHCYIGETHRILRSRIQEHISQQSSFVFKHFYDVHSCAPSLPNITVDIVGSGFADTHQRKVAEFRAITAERPQINIVYHSKP